MTQPTHPHLSDEQKAKSYCLHCEKHGHRTCECWSTHAVNDRGREIDALATPPAAAEAPFTFTDATLDAGHAVVTAAGGYRIGLLPNMLKAMLATRVNAEASAVKDCSTVAEAAAMVEVQVGVLLDTDHLGYAAEFSSKTIVVALHEVVRIAKIIAAQPKADSTEPSVVEQTRAFVQQAAKTPGVPVPIPKPLSDAIKDHIRQRLATPSPVNPARPSREWYAHMAKAEIAHEEEHGPIAWPCGGLVNPESAQAGEVEENPYEHAWKAIAAQMQACLSDALSPPFGLVAVLEVIRQYGEALRPKAQPLTGEKGLPASQEPKYTIDGQYLVNRASGEPIPHDEPVFIFRGRDAKALSALWPYHDHVDDKEHRAAVYRRIQDFKAFEAAHPERMKEPDTGTASPTKGEGS